MSSEQVYEGKESNMKKMIGVILIFILLITSLTACRQNADVPTTDVDNTSDFSTVAPMPSSEISTENETIFTRDITKENKEKALAQIYNTAKTHFASWDVFTLEDWDAAYPPVLERVLATDNVYDFYMKMKQFVALLNDHHSTVSFPQSFFEEVWFTPIRFIYIDDSYYIVGGNADELDKLPLFSQIIKIDGIPVDSYLEENVYPYIWHAKLNTSFNGEGSLLARFGPENTSQSFEVLTPSGEIITATIDRIPFQNSSGNWIDSQLIIDAEFEDIYASDLLTIARINNDFIYVFIPHFQDEDVVTQFEEHLDILKESKGIMIDLRGNQGGNSAYAAQIAEHFISGTFSDVYAEKSVYDKESNTYTLSEIPLTTMQGKGDINTPVVILQDYLTFSAGEHFLDFISAASNVVTVGTESAGATGDSKVIELPENGAAYITYNKISCHDKTPFLNIGIQPDIFVTNTIDDYKNGHDNILSSGLAELSKMCSGN